MALTKLDYLRIAERVEAMYMNCSTQLVLNIVRHLASGKGLSTAEWQLKKLSEMQSLTRESMEIIAANTGKRREAVEQAFREVFGIGLADTEKVLQAAVKAGKLFPVPSVEESEAMRQLLQAYIGQADDALNLVNTVMLDSTLSRYRYYVNQIDMESQKEAARILQKLGATDEKGLGTNLAYTQNVLNTQSTGVVTGAVARQKAVRDAIKDLAANGITGFVDAGGHHWTPEAYVNMDIRTTAHNVAIEAQKQRSAEYGVSTFQISTHAGARPLCAPYQGWICSWDNSGGTVTDLYGKEYQVHGINETSYGEAAGIFGINCGHFPETFVDGFSVPRYEELTPEQEKQNEIEYAQSQQQRELEREIRQAKTEAAAYSAAGDKAEFQKAAAKVKEKQTDYKQFCEQTGRTPRPDRTQVSTYSRSEASKVSWSNRKNPTEPKPPRDFTPKPKKPQFVPASNIGEAETYFAKMCDSNRFGAIGVSYAGVSLDVANEVNRTIGGLYSEYRVDPFGGIQAPKGNTKLGMALGDSATAGYVPVRHSFLLNRKSMSSVSKADEMFRAESDAIRNLLEHPERYDFSKLRSSVRAVIERSKSSGRATVPTNIQEALTHEFGHALEKGVKRHPEWAVAKANMPQFADRISGYAGYDEGEYIAESFASFVKGEKLCDPIMIRIFKSLRR